MGGLVVDYLWLLFLCNWLLSLRWSKGYLNVNKLIGNRFVKNIRRRLETLELIDYFSLFLLSNTSHWKNFKER